MIIALVVAGAAAGAAEAIGSKLPTVAGAGAGALFIPTPKLNAGFVLAVALVGAAALKFPNTGGTGAVIVPLEPKLNP